MYYTCMHVETVGAYFEPIGEERVTMCDVQCICILCNDQVASHTRIYKAVYSAHCESIKFVEIDFYLKWHGSGTVHDTSYDIINIH